MATVIAYIDGFNLYHGLHERYRRHAVSLVADTAAEASDIALIISADSDLCPAIRAARSLPVQRGMIAAFPPRRSSFEIRSLIPAAFTIGQDKLRKSLLPDRVIDPTTGAVFKRRTTGTERISPAGAG